jgi:hypothetical protein
VHLGAAARGAQQRLLQFAPHLVVEDDEGFEQHLMLGRTDALEHAREEGLAVFEQGDPVAGNPVRVHVESAYGRRGHASVVQHTVGSTACFRRRTDIPRFAAYA